MRVTLGVSPHAAPPMRAYQDNLRLGQLEYEQRHVYLHSRPRCLGLVLGNQCNLNCIHCYQAKNRDALLDTPEIAVELRRELKAFYPHIATLRIQGGEVFAMPGFRELIDDVAASVRRPILSVSTNGTLIDDEWAERMVRTPFVSVTVSIDGATRATYSRIRGGADLDQVLANIDRLQRRKAAARSELPHLDSFFVILRSNLREIPQYLELMREHGMIDVTLQTMELSPENIARRPSLEADEAITDRREVEELHAILREALPRFRKCFRVLRVSGLQALFNAHGLAAAFLEEGGKSLYPDSDGLGEGAFDLCPNPWTTLFVTESGDTHLCFLSRPIGNLYREPLAALWNSPSALAKRRDMIMGSYLASGCSPQYCSWREGKPSPGRPSDGGQREWRELAGNQPGREIAQEAPGALALVRRLMAEEDRGREELEAHERTLESLLEAGQRHIDQVEAKANKAVADFRGLEAAFAEYRKPWLVRAARKMSTALGALRHMV